MRAPTADEIGPRRTTALVMALTATAAAVEAMVLLAASNEAALSLAPQASAPPPFGLFHDLRWLSVFHAGWLAFVASLGALVVFRTALLTVIVRLAWPADVARPPLGAHVRRGLTFVIVGSLALMGPVLLSFSVGVVSLSWVVFAEVGILLLVATFTHHTAVAPAGWRRLPPPRSVAWVLATFAVLTMAAAAVIFAPPWAAVAIAASTGAFSGWAWRRIVAHLARIDTAPRSFPVAGAAVVGVLGVSLLGMLVLSPAAPPPSSPSQVDHADAPDAAPVLIAAGFASHFDGTMDFELGPEFREWRFSYAGLGPDGRPRPYHAEQTQAPLDELARLMADHVDALHRLTGRPVHIAASSEGSVVARTYLAFADDPPVTQVLLLSPLVRPARVYYPEVGETGWGVATGWGLRGLGWLLTAASSYELDPDQPFLRSLLDHAPALRLGMACPSHHTPIEALIPIAAVTAIPANGGPHIPITVVNGLHGAALDHLEATETLQEALLTGEPTGAGPIRLSTRVLRAGAQAWQPPELPLSLNPVWEDGLDGEWSSECELADRAFDEWASTR